MPTTRQTKLIDCNPKWVENADGSSSNHITFDCPEGHEGCVSVLPFTPALDGSLPDMTQSRAWQRTGNSFETLTLSPSIRRVQHYPTREAAIQAGCLPEYVTESMMCALHIFIREGQIEFCGDSK